MLPICAKFISDRCIELNCELITQAGCIALFKWLSTQSLGQLPEGQWVLGDGQIVYLLTKGVSSTALFNHVEALLEERLHEFSLADDYKVEGVQHELKVNWGGENGPDLLPVARGLGLSVESLVESFYQLELTVAFNGFLPGFAYLLGLPKHLHLARRDTPRTRVNAGSVAIAGGYAAIYPQTSPGGWHLLGSCDSPLFDTSQDQPVCLLKPGDRVKFVE